MSCKTSVGSGPLSLFDIGWQHGPGYASCWYCVRICLAPVSHFVTPPPPPQNAWHVNWWICDENIQTLDLEVECPLQCPPDMKRAHRLDLGQDVSEPLILKPDDILAKLTPQRWFLWVRATDRFLWYFSLLKIIFDSILFRHCTHVRQILQAELLYICVGKYFVTIEHTAENSYCRNFGVSAKWRKWRDHPPVSSSSCSSLCEREAEAG